eukprot:TRINITY_DN2209_c0_g1_i1.p1 TRINITY_DN2209_c0_g1~~TRINITY_DN2209_c0_g1_i1.p1  ORF type:complete len:1000 (-),score=135.87 TRINITY_DN2209_c0_g1_i1:21-2984(-)
MDLGSLVQQEQEVTDSVELLLTEIRAKAPSRGDDFSAFLRVLAELPEAEKSVSAVELGSFSAETALAAQRVADFVVPLPSGCGTPAVVRAKEYFLRRNAFVAAMQKHLTTKGKAVGIVEVQLKHLSEDVNKPYIACRLAAPERHAHVHFGLVAPAATIKHCANPQQRATEPYYTQAVLEDWFLWEWRQTLHQRIGVSPAMRKACVLLKAWVHSHGFAAAGDSINSFTITALLVYLMDSRLVSPQMTVWQIFRQVLHFLSVGEFAMTGAVMALRGESAHPPAAVTDSFRSAFSVVLLNDTHNHNIFFRLSPNARDEVQHAATRALAQLEASPEIDLALTSLIRWQHPFWEQYDTFFRVTVPEGTQTPADFATAVVDVLYRAWGARVLRIRIKIDPEQRSTVFLGVLLSENARVAYSPITKGPSIDLEEELQAFTEFWGATSVTRRRFPDGSVTAAVLWTDSPPRLILRDIARHALQMHASVRPNSFDQIIFPLNEVVSKAPEEDAKLFTAAGAALTALSEVLEHCQVNPRLVGLLPAHPAFSRTSAFPPLPHMCLERSNQRDTALPAMDGISAPALEVVLELQKSPHWPEDLTQLQQVKTALFRRLVWFLASRGYPSHTLPDGLIVAVDGFALHVRTYVPREENTLRLSSRVQEADAYHHQLVVVPHHTALIREMTGKYASYGLACRLAKRWLASHLLLPDFSEECVELLVLHLYVQPAPLSQPQTATVAFLRFLQLLAGFPWDTKALYVKQPDENEPVACEDYEQRPATTAMWVAAAHCRDSPFTAKGPDRAILQRAQQCARAAATLFAKVASRPDLPADNAALWYGLFKPGLGPYHLIIELDPQHVPFTDQSLFHPAPPASTPRIQGALALRKLIGFDPIAYLLHGLRVTFMSCMFFRDPYGGQEIAVYVVDEATSADLPKLAAAIRSLAGTLVKKVRILQTPTLTKASTVAAAPANQSSGQKTSKKRPHSHSPASRGKRRTGNQS